MLLGGFAVIVVGSALNQSWSAAALAAGRGCAVGALLAAAGVTGRSVSEIGARASVAAANPAARPAVGQLQGVLRLGSRRRPLLGWAG
jgi:hypothetical protein